MYIDHTNLKLVFYYWIFVVQTKGLPLKLIPRSLCTDRMWCVPKRTRVLKYLIYRKRRAKFLLLQWNLIYLLYHIFYTHLIWRLVFSPSQNSGKEKLLRKAWYNSFKSFFFQYLWHTHFFPFSSMGLCIMSSCINWGYILVLIPLGCVSS